MYKPKSKRTSKQLGTVKKKTLNGLTANKNIDDIIALSKISNTQTTEIKSVNSGLSKVSASVSSKQNKLSLTTTGTSGPATLSNDVLNIPQYSGGGGSYVPYTGATGDVDLGEHEIKAGQVEFDQTPTGTAGVAVMRWNDQDGTVDIGLKGGNVTLQVGQEQVTRVVNKTGINLLEANYQAVRISGAQGNRLKVDLAQANNDANSADTIGIVTETINDNQEGFVTTSGLVRNIDTTGSLQSETWADGDLLYLSGAIAGQITNIKPSAPIHTVIMGYVVRAHATQGQIYVKVDNGYELDELHNVAITSPANNDLLQYDSATSLWKNESLSAAGVQPTLSLTTTGTSGPATLVGSTLNIPQYTGGGGSTFGTHIVVNPQSGVYYSTAPFTQTSVMTLSANTYCLAPFTPKNNLNVNELRIEVTTAIAAGLATILIFSDLNGLPRTKLLESTNLDCSTTGMKTFTTTFSFVAGTTYWLGASSNAAIGFRSNGNSFALQHHASSTAVNPQYAKSATFGSVPSTITILPNSDAFSLQPIIIRFRAV